MDDNPSLTPAIKRRYESLYSGAFYDRFVLGKWVAAQGLVYPFFSRSVHVAEPEGIPSHYFISCDYGTVNPSSFGLWGEYGGRWYRLSEYYFDSRREGEQRTDEEHYAALEQIVAKTGLPPFMLGLSWSSTERMSAQQADVLTSEIDAYRRILTPVVERICRTYLLLEGTPSQVEVEWDDAMLQDNVELARAELYAAQAEKIRKEIENGE